MLPQQQATLDLYAATKRRGVTAALLARREWEKGVSPKGDWAAQWLKAIPRVVALTTAAQLGAVVDGFASVSASLEQQGHPEETLAALDPAGFTGWVESHAGAALIPLSDYLYPAVIHARMAQGGPEQMLTAGGLNLSTLVRTAVADASTQGAQAGLHAHENTRGAWYDPPPYCKRCAVIVGRDYPVTTQFVRHPQCDGQVMAISAKNHEIEWPRLDESQIKGLTDAEREAIGDGADIYRVIQSSTQLVGGKSKGSPLYAGGTKTMAGLGRNSRKVRPTPKGIYAMAGDDREAAVSLLKKYGYMK